MLTITQISFEQIETYKSVVKKERVTLDNPPEAVWFGAHQNNELVGFAAAVIKKKSARLKSDYVFKEYRGKGIYNELFKHRLQYVKEQNVKTVTAFCTKLSLGTFMRYGFKPYSQNRYGIMFVKREI